SSRGSPSRRSTRSSHSLAPTMHPDLLSSILNAISKRVNQQSFNMWFKPISSARKDDSSIYLGVPNEVFRDWISNNYFDVIEESLHELDLDSYELRFVIDDTPVPAIRQAEPLSGVSSRAKVFQSSDQGFAAGVV